MNALLVMSNLVEDMEAIGTRDLLMRAGFKVVTGTFEESLSLKTSHGLAFDADMYAQNLDVKDFDLLIIPGGPYVAKTVDRDIQIKELAKTFSKEGKWIAAICAGPRFLGQAGLLKGKKYTAFRGSEIDGKDGEYLPENKALVDGKLITARGAGAVYEFAYFITKELISKEKADEIREKIMY